MFLLAMLLLHSFLYIVIHGPNFVIPHPIRCCYWIRVEKMCAEEVPQKWKRLGGCVPCNDEDDDQSESKFL